jgi:hypothetical protein
MEELADGMYLSGLVDIPAFPADMLSAKSTDAAVTKGGLMRWYVDQLFVEGEPLSEAQAEEELVVARLVINRLIEIDGVLLVIGTQQPSDDGVVVTDDDQQLLAVHPNYTPE